MLAQSLAGLANRGVCQAILMQWWHCSRFWSALAVLWRTCLAISLPCEIRHCSCDFPRFLGYVLYTVTWRFQATQSQSIAALREFRISWKRLLLQALQVQPSKRVVVMTSQDIVPRSVERGRRVKRKVLKCQLRRKTSEWPREHESSLKRAATLGVPRLQRSCYL